MQTLSDRFREGDAETCSPCRGHGSMPQHSKEHTVQVQLYDRCSGFFVRARAPGARLGGVGADLGPATASCSTTRHGTAGHGRAPHGTAWHRMARESKAEHTARSCTRVRARFDNRSVHHPVSSRQGLCPASSRGRSLPAESDKSQRREELWRDPFPRTLLRSSPQDAAELPVDGVKSAGEMKTRLSNKPPRLQIQCAHYRWRAHTCNSSNHTF